MMLFRSHLNNNNCYIVIAIPRQSPTAKSLGRKPVGKCRREWQSLTAVKKERHRLLRAGNAATRKDKLCFFRGSHLRRVTSTTTFSFLLNHFFSRHPRGCGDLLNASSHPLPFTMLFHILYLDKIMGKQYYVYILTNIINTVLYTGVTSDLVRRVFEHMSGAVNGFSKR
jgi:hypothetical protein